MKKRKKELFLLIACFSVIAIFLISAGDISISSGEPVENVSVGLNWENKSSNKSYSLSEFTDSSGFYNISISSIDESEGNVSINVFYLGYLTEDLQPFAMGPGESCPKNITLTPLETNSTISGYIKYENETEIGNSSVTASWQINNETVANYSLTNSEGEYSINVLGGRNVTLSVNREGFFNFYSQLLVNESQETSNITLKAIPEKDSWVNGTVMNSSGNGIENAIVSLTWYNLTSYDNFNTNALTDSNGRYSINIPSANGTSSAITSIITDSEYYFSNTSSGCSLLSPCTTPLEKNFTLEHIPELNAEVYGYVTIENETSEGGQEMIVNKTAINVPENGTYNVNDTVRYVINITNVLESGVNLTNISLLDEFPWEINYTGSGCSLKEINYPKGDYENSSGIGNFTINITSCMLDNGEDNVLEINESFDFEINFTIIDSVPSVLNGVEVSSNDSDGYYHIEGDEERIFMEDEEFSDLYVEKHKIKEPGPAIVNNTVGFVINLSSIGDDNITDIWLNDTFNNTYLNFTGESSCVVDSSGEEYVSINVTDCMLNQMGKDTLIPNESFEIYLNFTALKEKENATNNVLINATCSGEEGSENCSEYETSFFDIFSEVPKKPGFTFQINITNAPQNFSFQIDDPNDIFIEWGDDFHELIEENSTFVIHEYTENSVYNVSLSGNASRIAFYKEEDWENVASSGLIIDVLTPVYNASSNEGVRKITSTKNMFRDCSNITNFTEEKWFDDISGNITDMNYMFADSSFNQNISSWDVSNVQNMGYMFSDNSAFNKSLNAWDVSNVQNMEYIFRGTSFNQDISSWNVSNVQNMAGMFSQASSFNQNISSWDVSNVQDTSFMFRESDFNQNISSWDVSNVENMRYMFAYNSAFNKSLNSWDVSNVTDMASMFSQATSFNQNISAWNVSNVQDMRYMFNRAEDFNQNISLWDVSNVTDMASMFSQATSFNQDISNWDVSNVENMRFMFSDTPFNQNISAWNVSKVTDMTSMFSGASSFNNGGSSLINQWDVSSVEDMGSMFEESSFNQPIGSWDVSNVGNNLGSMYQMFMSSSFNQDISSWDVSNVESTREMFRNTPFNQSIGNWNTSGISNMNAMFRDASRFNQDISSWDVSNVTDMNNMFLGGKLSRENYDLLLREWINQNVQENVSFHGGDSEYCLGEFAREEFINTYNWDINDGGKNCTGFSPLLSIDKNATRIEFGKGSINISWSVANSTKLSRVNFNVTYPNNTLLYRDFSKEGSVIFVPGNLSDKGIYNISLWANNTLGESSSKRDSFYVNDTTSPSVSIYKNTSILELGKDSIYMNWTTGDISEIDSVRFNVSFDGGEIYSSSSEINETILTPISLSRAGNYTINLWAKDSTGNENQTLDSFYVEDTTKPEINFTIPTTPQENVSQDWIYANVSANDGRGSGISNVSIYLYNGTEPIQRNFSNSSFSINFTGLYGGTYFLNATAKDFTGNLNYIVREIELDTKEPNLSFNPSSTPLGIYSQDWIFINVTAFDKNLDYLSFYVGEEEKHFNSSGDFNENNIYYLNATNLNDGFYMPYVTAGDSAGNEASVSKNITLDNNSPLVDVISPDNKTFTNDATPEISFNLTDNLASNISYNLYVNKVLDKTGSMENNTVKSVNLSELSEGINKIVLEANDSINLKNSSTLYLKIDTSAPVVNLTSPVNEYNSSSDPVDLKFIVTDGYPSTLNCSLTFNDTEHFLINSSVLNNTETIFTIYNLLDGSYKWNITCTDASGKKSPSLTRNFNVDTIPPVLSIYNPQANKSYSNGHVVLNFSVNDTNFREVQVNVDNGDYINSSNSSGDYLWNVTDLDVGYHLVDFSVSDYANNFVNMEIPFYMSGFVNMTEIIQILNQSLGNTSVKDVLFFENSTDISSNENFDVNNTNLSLRIVLNASGTEILTEIPEFNGMHANWGKNFTVEINSSSAKGEKISNNTGTSVENLILFEELSRFLDSDKFSKGARITFNKSLQDLDPLFIEDDSGDYSYRLNPCNGSIPLDVDMDNMCYVNTSDNVTLFVPHFSGGALVNDTFPPEINITNPENNSEINNSYFDFGLIVKELNPEGGYCNYTLSNVSGELISEELTIDDLLWASGAEYYFEKHLNNITNGNYSLKIFCVDSKNQGSEKTHNFTVEDTVSPTISNITVSKTTSSATISWITNEYSNSLINYTGGIINSTSFVKEHSLELTGLNADTTYSYNIASCDLNNQCVVNMDNNFTTNSESSDDGGGSSGGSSGGIVGGEVTEEESFWNLTINISQDNFFKGYSNKIGKGERFKVDINGEEHHIGVVNIDVKKEKVTINISSDTQQTVLSLGDTKKFDVNNDNYYDISVELLGIQDNKANLNIKSIYEEIPSEEQEEQEKNETKEEDVSEEDKDKNYLWIWIVAIVIIIAGIGFYLFKKRKDFFKNNKKTRFWKKKSS